MHRVPTRERTKRAQADERDRKYAPDVKRDLVLSSYPIFKRQEVPLTPVVQSHTRPSGRLASIISQNPHLTCEPRASLDPISSVSLYDNKPDLCTVTSQQRSEGHIYSTCIQPIPEMSK